MARRSTVDRSPQPVVHGADYLPAAGDLAHGGGRTPGRSAHWRGAGGRWLVWVFRVVAWLILLLIGYRGVTAIVLSETGSGSRPSVGAAPQSRFPVQFASAYALAFGQVYLSANPLNARERAAALASFVPDRTDPQLGWNGSGTLRLQSEQVAAVQVQDAHHAVVTLLARVNGRLMELGVPLYAANGRMAVTGEPAWLPAPGRATVPPAPTISPDPATQSILTSQLPAFFQAYASGNQVTLGRFLVPGAGISGLGGEVTFASLTGLTVPTGGTTRQVVATVLWHVGPASHGQQAGVTQAPTGLETTYALTVVKRNGTWYVASIRPSTVPAGSP